MLILLTIIITVMVVITTGGKMKKILLTLAILLTVPAYAQDNIDVCNNCRITYVQPKRVIKKVVQPVVVPPPYAVEYVPAGPGPISSTIPVPVPVPIRPVPMVPTYNYVPTPEASNIYSPPGYPTNVPVASSPNGCAMYVDPYDLFGQLFGGADLVQSCWRPAY